MGVASNFNDCNDTCPSKCVSHANMAFCTLLARVMIHASDGRRRVFQHLGERYTNYCMMECDRFDGDSNINDVGRDLQWPQNPLGHH